MSEFKPKPAPTLFAAALPPRPPGEDFFLVAVVIDSLDPCWNDGFDIVGTWEQVDKTFSAYVAERGIRRKHTISIYQGDAARAKLLEGLKEEARYQAQMQAQQLSHQMDESWRNFKITRIKFF
jgi:hypothetical protein